MTFWQAVDREVRNREEFISHPYAFQLIAYLLGVLIVFRTNFAYNRYWEAVGMVQAMGAKWADGTCMAVAFDASGRSDTPLLFGAREEPSCVPHPKHGHKGGPNHRGFCIEIMHLCSLMHALALQHLRDDPDLDNLVPANTLNTAHGDIAIPDFFRKGMSALLSKAEKSSSPTAKIGLTTYSQGHLKQVHHKLPLGVLGGLSRLERDVLESDGKGRALPTEVRVAMVEGWYMRRLINRQKFEEGETSVTSPPILSRLYQVISDGTLWFAHASKIAITPFPFPYHNLIAIFLWIFTFMVPILVNGIIMDTGLRAVICFFSVFCYHSLAAVGDNLEDPYLPYDPNELPLRDIQESMNMRLLAYGIVPEREESGLLTPNLTKSMSFCRPSTPKPEATQNGVQGMSDPGKETKEADSAASKADSAVSNGCAVSSERRSSSGGERASVKPARCPDILGFSQLNPCQK
jgi:hypothetical protein